MTKSETNLAAALLLARDEAQATTAAPAERLGHEGDAIEADDEGERDWIDDVTTEVAALWSGQRGRVPFEAAMARAEACAPRRRR